MFVISPHDGPPTPYAPATDAKYRRQPERTIWGSRDARGSVQAGPATLPIATTAAAPHISPGPIDRGPMVTPWKDQQSGWLSSHPFVLFVVLYSALAVIGLVVWYLAPAAIHEAIAALTNSRGLGEASASFSRGESRAPLPGAHLWAIAGVAMCAAGLLALPVAWLYTITRHKRGYRQSVVHSLILLPVVVAGVVVLVKFSLALAFSLAGIVAAVRFRNTLEDSKDAVYIFVVTAVGLSAGVELSVALTLSFIFNLVTLLLFRSDFGRNPGRLEGDMAEERMRRALAVANRTSQFVARLDREILEQMAPEQLEAVAERVTRRRKDVAGGGKGNGEDRYDAKLTVETDGSMHAREVVEHVLVQLAKRWRFVRAESPEAGGQVLVYELRVKKSVQPAFFVESLRREGPAGVRQADLA